jgi:hypothetical protein
MADERCGTYAGYQAHLAASDIVCDPCRIARNQYTRERLAKNPDEVAKDRRRSAAYKRALRRLSLEQDVRFRELYDEELTRVDA